MDRSSIGGMSGSLVVVALIIKTMDQDTMKKMMNSFKMGDMIRAVKEKYVFV